MSLVVEGGSGSRFDRHDHFMTLVEQYHEFRVYKALAILLYSAVLGQDRISNLAMGSLAKIRRPMTDVADAWSNEGQTLIPPNLASSTLEAHSYILLGG